jgi:hypothetical protein
MSDEQRSQGRISPGPCVLRAGLCGTSLLASLIGSAMELWLAPYPAKARA